VPSYIGGWRIRARDSSNPVPYVRVGPAPGVQERRIMGLIFRHLHWPNRLTTCLSLCLISK